MKILFSMRHSGALRNFASTLEELATASAGLSRAHLERLLKEAKGRARPLTHEEVKARKRELLRQEFQGMLEVLEPASLRNDVAATLQRALTSYEDVRR